MKVKKFTLPVSGLFLKLIYQGTGKVVYFLLLKFSMGRRLQLESFKDLYNGQYIPTLRELYLR